MHGYLVRRIPAPTIAGAERAESITALRQYYESKFIELTQQEAKGSLTGWILLQAQAEATRVADDPNTLTQLLDVYTKSQG